MHQVYTHRRPETRNIVKKVWRKCLQNVSHPRAAPEQNPARSGARQNRACLYCSFCIIPSPCLRLDAEKAPRRFPCTLTVLFNLTRSMVLQRAVFRQLYRNGRRKIHLSKRRLTATLDGSGCFSTLALPAKLYPNARESPAMIFRDRHFARHP